MTVPRWLAVAVIILGMVGADLAVPVLWGDVREGLMVTEQVLAHKGKPDPPKPDPDPKPDPKPDPDPPTDPEPPQEPPTPPRETPGGPDVPGSVWYVTWASQIEAGPFLERETCLPVAAQLTEARRRPHGCVRYAD